MGREWLRVVAMAVAVLVAGPIRLSAAESDLRDNWGLIAEVKFISDGAGDPTQFALESLITF